MNALLNSTQGAILIGAVIAIAGVLIGWIVAAASTRGVTKRAAKAKGAADARDLAMRTVLALDDFMGSCYSAAYDQPEFNPMDPGDFILHTDDPVLVLPRDANWALLRSDLGEEIIWLPNRLRNVVEALESIDISRADFGDYFEHRSDEFSRLGLRAFELMETLTAAYSLPLPSRPDFYRPKEGMQAKVAEMAAMWSRRRKAQRSVASETSNVMPLFAGVTTPKSAITPDSDPNS